MIRIDKGIKFRAHEKIADVGTLDCIGFGTTIGGTGTIWSIWFEPKVGHSVGIFSTGGSDWNEPDQYPAMAQIYAVSKHCVGMQGMVMDGGGWIWLDTIAKNQFLICG